MRLLRLAFAGCLLLLAEFQPASAQAPAAGSRNFEPPPSVPNYFSNEAGPFRGGTGAETTYSNSEPAVATPYQPAQAEAAAPRRTATRYAARANRHVRLAAHTRSGRHVARTRIAKKTAASRVAHAHAQPAMGKRAATKLASAKRPSASKTAATRRQPTSPKSRTGKDKRHTRTAAR